MPNVQRDPVSRYNEEVKKRQSLKLHAYAKVRPKMVTLPLMRLIEISQSCTDRNIGCNHQSYCSDWDEADVIEVYCFTLLKAKNSITIREIVRVKQDQLDMRSLYTGACEVCMSYKPVVRGEVDDEEPVYITGCSLSEEKQL